jgi:hypothetical protein
MALAAVGVGQRLLLEKYGRRVSALSLDNDEKIVHPWSVEDFRDAGTLTVLTGADIYDVFRAQLPVNPRMYTVENLLDVDPDHTYLLTNEPSVFQRLNETLPNLEIYRSGGIIFNGVSIPRAYVLVSDRTKKKLLTQPVGIPDDLLPGSSDKYLYLTNLGTPTVLSERNLADFNYNVILKSDDILHDESRSKALLNGPGKIYVMEKNAMVAQAETNLNEDRLLLYHGTRSSPWYQGVLKSPDLAFFATSLSLLLAAVAFLGLFLQGYPFRWATWLLAGIVVYFLGIWHFVLLGLLAAGLIQLGLRVRAQSVGWFLLAGLIVYGFGYKPYEFVPFQSQLGFWSGAVGGLFLLSGGWRSRLQSRPTYADLVVVLAGVAVVSLVLPGWGYTVGPELLSLSTVLLPFVPLLVRSDDSLFNFVWLIGLASWGYYLLGNTLLVAPFYFVFVMVFWWVFRSVGRLNDQYFSVGAT